MNNELDLIYKLRDKFDLNDISDYQSLLMIIKNNFFKQECIERYETFKLIDEVINGFERSNITVLSADDLTNYFISEHAQRNFR